MSRLVDDKLAPRYNGATHWAKLEVPAEGTELAKLRARLAARFPVAKVCFCMTVFVACCVWGCGKADLVSNKY